jgi:hypothetical protein
MLLACRAWWCRFPISWLWQPFNIFHVSSARIYHLHCAIGLPGYEVYDYAWFFSTLCFTVGRMASGLPVEILQEVPV